MKGKSFTTRTNFRVVFPQGTLDDRELDKELIAKLGKNYSAVEPTDGYGTLMFVYLMVTIGLFALPVAYVPARQRTDVRRRNARRLQQEPRPNDTKDGERAITFDDVAGLERVKSELEEIVDFLKNPAKFQASWRTRPQGRPLDGPSRNRKDVTRKSGRRRSQSSLFLDHRLGIHPNVRRCPVPAGFRDMFAVAKESSPSILFIDEIDAVGRHRGTGLGRRSRRT